MRDNQRACLNPKPQFGEGGQRTHLTSVIDIDILRASASRIVSKTHETKSQIKCAVPASMFVCYRETVINGAGTRDWAMGPASKEAGKQASK